jgi:hypothetical protein
MTFKEFYILNERPYIEVPEHGGAELFDIELEKYSKDLSGLKAVLYNILIGKPTTDKYGNTIQLKTHEEKVDFIKHINDDSEAQLFFQKYHPETSFIKLVQELKTFGNLI